MIVTIQFPNYNQNARNKKKERHDERRTCRISQSLQNKLGFDFSINDVVMNNISQHEIIQRGSSPLRGVPYYDINVQHILLITILMFDNLLYLSRFKQSHTKKLFVTNSHQFTIKYLSIKHTRYRRPNVATADRCAAAMHSTTVVDLAILRYMHFTPGILPLPQLCYHFLYTLRAATGFSGHLSVVL